MLILFVLEVGSDRIADMFAGKKMNKPFLVRNKFTRIFLLVLLYRHKRTTAVRDVTSVQPTWCIGAPICPATQLRADHLKLKTTAAERDRVGQDGNPIR